MSLQERIYSVLVVSSGEKLNLALSSLLTAPLYRPVRIISDVSSAKRIWNARPSDVLIINSPLPDDPGIRFAIDAAGSKESVVLLLVRAEFYDDVFEKVVPHGVFVLSKPVSRPALVTALDWMGSMRERLRVLSRKTLSVEEKMEEIRLVNRAKWVLISERGMDEAEAHRYIEKEAMDRCVPKKLVAEEIIGGN